MVNIEEGAGGQDSWVLFLAVGGEWYLVATVRQAENQDSRVLSLTGREVGSCTSSSLPCDSYNFFFSSLPPQWVFEFLTS